MIFPHFTQCPAFDLDQYSPRKNAPQCGQRFVENIRTIPAIKMSKEKSMIILFGNSQPIRKRNAKEYSSINANLFFVLLTYFFIKTPAFAKFSFVSLYPYYHKLTAHTRAEGVAKCRTLCSLFNKLQNEGCLFSQISRLPSSARSRVISSAYSSWLPTGMP